LKDIENSMAQSAAALARLERALGRLDAAARKARAGAAPAATPQVSSDDVAKLKRDHAALKEATGRVATRLDETIARLAAGLREAG
jgi:uncharacterized protein with von Willebrand factor type A (vWA) domain